MIVPFIEFIHRGGLSAFREAVKLARETGESELVLRLPMKRTEGNAVLVGPTVEVDEQTEKFEQFEILEEEK